MSVEWGRVSGRKQKARKNSVERIDGRRTQSDEERAALLAVRVHLSCYAFYSTDFGSKLSVGFTVSSIIFSPYFSARNRSLYK